MPRHTHRVEQDAVNEVLRYLNLERDDCYAWRNNTGKLPDRNGRWVAFGDPGSGDILGVWRGRAVAVECKAAWGVQTDGQRAWQRRWERFGGLYILARSVDVVRTALETATATVPTTGS